MIAISLTIPNIRYIYSTNSCISRFEMYNFFYFDKCNIISYRPLLSLPSTVRSQQHDNSTVGLCCSLAKYIVFYKVIVMWSDFDTHSLFRTNVFLLSQNTFFQMSSTLIKLVLATGFATFNAVSNNSCLIYLREIFT